ncbi:MAG: Asp-tRNA(Asn)/Glu-tRNA(Gln) amidotransferase GatCAB subunit B, partial [Candidatus Onthovivens sp.]|nr:Asp-tRNA(Asn)/Glu-tRNA(Gln) amidotransferase GatCAB subunit B [Candidatus Onthovivens sp.]
DLLKSKEINSTQGADIFAKLIKENRSPLKIKEETGATLINDEDKIRQLVLEVISLNPTLPSDFKAGKTRAQGFVMGQIMRKTGGKINPAIANKIIVEELNK